MAGGGKGASRGQSQTADRAPAPSAPAPGAPTPGGLLADYPAQAGPGDLYRGATPEVAQAWARMARGLADLSTGGAGVAEQIARQIQDLGLTFRVKGDTDERAWPLNPMPLVIGADEWARVEAALIQRAELLETLAADIYGPRRLVAEGHLPAAMITGSPYFARKMIGLLPEADHFLHVYAVDLARGPQGQWRVLGDRLRLANGIGYALENRLAMSRATGSLLAEVHTRRLAGFFGELREGIARDCQRERPRIALLSPGQMNQSYSEQAHLARYLGFPLVEGRDLVVQDDRLFLRTIAGPKRVDAIWRWIDTNALDPLSFDSRSQLGVPDLFFAWARGGLEMANWPGVEVLESRAMAAFMPRLAQELLGEDLLMPNIATWWCGQSVEADTVRQRLDELVIAPAFGISAEGLPEGAVAGASLDPAARAALLDAMRRRPMDYCGQEIVQLSTTPALVDDGQGASRLAPRPFTLRAFVTRGAQGEWVVMPGGFARLSSSGDLTSSLMGSGDLSADVCIVDAAPRARETIAAQSVPPRVQRGRSVLASQAADNLFWFSRYAERAEFTARVLRSILGSSIDVDGGAGHDEGVNRALVQLLWLWGAIDTPTADAPLVEVCARALAEADLPGGVAALIRRSQEAGLALRERFARDFWHIAGRRLPVPGDRRPQSLLAVANQLIERSSALAGQVSENMMRGPAWAFLDMGRRLERALTICRITRQLAFGETARPMGSDGLSVLLDLCDSQITYRSRYLAEPAPEAVLDLVLLDPDNPRSLVWQVEQLTDHIAGLPTLNDEHLPEAPLREARAILAPLQTLMVDELDDAVLRGLESRLMALSDTISTRYFLPVERAEASAGEALLA